MVILWSCGFEDAFRIRCHPDLLGWWTGVFRTRGHAERPYVIAGTEIAKSQLSEVVREDRVDSTSVMMIPWIS